MLLFLTTLTPFYSEDVILSEADLRKKIVMELRLIVSKLYIKRMERLLGTRGIDDHAARDAVFSSKHATETRLWAPFRADLARTVEGIMQNEAALRLLASWRESTTLEEVGEEQGPRNVAIICRACDESPTHPQIS